jgi:hypothetical protein
MADISFSLYRKMDSLDPGLKDVLLSMMEEVERNLGERVNRDDYLELKSAVLELVQTQKAAVEALAQAQKAAEERLGRLEAAVEALAEAQKRTEASLEKLIREHAKTREQLGGLSLTVGYRLEDEAIKSLPALLHKDHGLEVKGRLRRGYLKDRAGRSLEVNLYGEAARNGETVLIIGEAKSQLSRKGVDEFLRKRVKEFKDAYPVVFPVLITYMTTSADVEDYAREKGIALYFSFDL